MGRMTSHILWEIKNVPNHQPAFNQLNYSPTTLPWHVDLSDSKKGHPKNLRFAILFPLESWFWGIPVYPILSHVTFPMFHIAAFISNNIPLYPQESWWISPIFPHVPLRIWPLRGGLGIYSWAPPSCQEHRRSLRPFRCTLVYLEMGYIPRYSHFHNGKKKWENMGKRWLTIGF